MKPTCSTTVQGPMYKSINFHNHVCSVRHHCQLEGDVAEYADLSLLTHLWESSRSPDHKLLSPGQDTNLPKKSRSGWKSLGKRYGAITNMLV